MSKNKTLKQSLKSNNITFGSWITLGHPAVPELMGQSRFDWLTVDMEHSAITLSDAQRLIQVISLSGMTPLVRVGENNPNLIKRVMDAGAHGVIVPMVNNSDDARKAVSSVKYPPAGTRGVGLARAQGYGFDFESYKEWNNLDSIVIAQVEHKDSIENLESILEVDGIDGTIIGPYDLSGSFGYPGEFDRREVSMALEQYEKISRKINKPMGVHVVQPDPVEARKYIDKGYTFIAVGLDILYLGSKCREVMGALID